MSSLSSEQKQQLFDYCLGLTSEKEGAEAELLIACNDEAADIHTRLKTLLSLLDSLEIEPCPDELVEGTIWRVNKLSNAGPARLPAAAAAEQAQAVSAKGSFWRNFGEMAAVAVVILFIAGVLIPTLSGARQKYWQKRCQVQLGSIFDGLSNYILDHDGKPPAVRIKAGAPWWKVGCQGEENCSNTRHIWLLVKDCYVEPVNFVCPGRSYGRALQFKGSQVQIYNDFPAKRYITYSIRLRCPNSPYTFGQKPIISDANPIFDSIENPTADTSGELRLQLNDRLLRINSHNHKGRGQNVLFGDGSVSFTGRQVGNDDIFTLQQMRPGFEVKGCELPSCVDDNFLAP